MAVWRQMSHDDVDGLLHVASRIHPDLPESREVFVERLRLFPNGCLVLANEDEICGYAISHPIRHGEPPALDSLLGEISSDADQYYIHDIAILAEYRGGGLAVTCILQILAIAKAYPTTCLISVYGTGAFWRRFGFITEAINEDLQEKLAKYGDDAVFLSRQNSK